jgi:hypothetical protein
MDRSDRRDELALDASIISHARADLIASVHCASDRLPNCEQKSHDQQNSKLRRIFAMFAIDLNSLLFAAPTDRPHIAAFILPSTVIETYDLPCHAPHDEGTRHYATKCDCFNCYTFATSTSRRPDYIALMDGRKFLTLQSDCQSSVERPHLMNRTRDRTSASLPM